MSRLVATFSSYINVFIWKNDLCFYSLIKVRIILSSLIYSKIPPPFLSKRKGTLQQSKKISWEENYVKESRERLLTAARFVDIDLIEPIRETTTEAKKQKKEGRTISLEQKILQVQFVRQTKEVENQDRW